MIASKKAGVAVVGALVALAGCGGSSGSGGKTIDIYSSLPLKGATSQQTVPMVNGIKLALAQSGGKAGKFKVNYTSLDDSTTTSTTGYDLNVCQQDARTAGTDAKAVYFIGAFNSGCSKVIMPILNKAGLAEVSPANTYVGLTVKDAGNAPGEPGIYYPTGKRNYLRIVPTDAFQSVADVVAMKQAGCTRVALANDKTPYGAGLAQQISMKKGSLVVTGDTALDPTAPNYRAYASSLKAQGVNCVFTGFNPPGWVQLVKDINGELPNAKIFGGDAICSGAETNPKDGGIPATIAPKLECTVATLGLSGFPGGKQFLAAYKAKYGVSDPDPYAIYGYEAMKLGLDTIAVLGSKGNNKADVIAALFATKNRHSVLGTYSFLPSGDTSTTAYGLYKVGPDGNPLFVKAVG